MHCSTRTYGDVARKRIKLIGNHVRRFSLRTSWGNLSTFAATLKKGTHVSVEGELRYREFVPKKQKKSKNGDHKIRVAQIHLSKIAKLDRAERRDSNAPVPELDGLLLHLNCFVPHTASRVECGQSVYDVVRFIGGRFACLFRQPDCFRSVPVSSGRRACVVRQAAARRFAPR
jgi:hypothetical protein